jgi:hypothetical protein
MSSSVLESLSEIALSGPENPITGKDEGIFSKLMKIINDFKDSLSNPHIAFEVFEKNLLFLKSFGLSILIILAIVNYYSYKNVGLISEKPGLFAFESGVFGLSGVIPFVMLCYLRNGGHFTNTQVIHYSIAMFIVFFLLNYVLEMGGLYSATFYDKTESNKNAENIVSENEANLSYSDKFLKSLTRTSNVVMLLIFVSSFIMMLFSAAMVKDLKPSYVKMTNINPYGIFVIEMLLFGIISAVPIFFMASNRGALSNHTIKEFLLIVLKFSALHCILQASGFYAYIFTGLPPK